MINPQELRIGNLVEIPVLSEDDTIFTEKICADFGFAPTHVNSSIIMDCERYKEDWAGRPIKLTEEWLLKFGFEKDEDGCLCHEYPDSNCKFYFVKDFIQVAKGYAAIFNYKHINYVHQLQNIYFALTGKELETI